MKESQKTLKSQITQSIVGMGTVMAVIATMFCVRVLVAAEEDVAANTTHETVQKAPLTEAQAGVTKYALIGAAIAFGLGAIGAGIAISHVGAAAMGAVAEKPQVAGQALIFVALAEGLVVFGFITALMILGKA